MKRTCITLCLLIFPAIATITLVTSALAQTVVVGTGNPDLDIPAVQAAVDQGGEVILKGVFSFDRNPTIVTALPAPTFPQATVLISKAVVVSGAQDDDEDKATIKGGTIPFYVEAPGASVEIRKLHFVGPSFQAILVYAVSGLTIASNTIERVVPVKQLAFAIELVTLGNIPSPTTPGKPENINGRLSITNNRIDMVGGGDQDNTLGITLFSVGRSPDKEVDVLISGNHISNTTEPAINLRRIGGRAQVTGNVIATGTVSSLRAPRPEVIRVVNIGSYLISHNRIYCQWPDPEAIGIGVFSQFPEWPMQRATVVDNVVTMSPPAGTAFGALSAGIDVRGFASDNVVLNNKIRGTARAALGVDSFSGGNPANTALILNRLDDFEASRADVFIDTGATNTLLVGEARTVENHDASSIIVPFHDSRAEK